MSGGRSKWGKVKADLAAEDVRDVGAGREFVVTASSEERLTNVRGRLKAAGLEEVDGDTSVDMPLQPPSQPVRASEQQRRGNAMPPSIQSAGGSNLAKKPYSFVQLPEELTSAPPIWHDGTGTAGRLSGEVRFDIETLTPLLVGWERRRLDESWSVPYVPATGGDLDGFLQRAARQAHPDSERPNQQRSVEDARRQFIERVRGNVVEVGIEGAGRVIRSKSVLCPLRAPWGEQPVLLPADSLKGLLRHEIGALLGAPMERVAERSYSYRPNSLFPNQPNPRLVARLARIPEGGVVLRSLFPTAPDSVSVRVPAQLELLPQNLKYDRQHENGPPRYRFDVNGAASYRGGLGAGERLNSKRRLHASLEATPDSPLDSQPVPAEVQDGYLHTIRHLVDLDQGHFSERHPDVPNTISGEEARSRILDAAETVVFQTGDLIWVEWDTSKKRIVSLGWHYYYRWAYTDTVRRKEWMYQRQGLFPLVDELSLDADKAPMGLSAVRRMFGYTGDNEGSKGIGKGDHEQLMGRLFVNTAIEVVEPDAARQNRFLPPTFLRELGMPRPSAAEHYLEQPYHPKPRPTDKATLVTYGDAAGYDKPGKLAGRKFYLDRSDAYTSEPWKDESEANRLNDRSTLALEASPRGRRFRFALRFRDLEPTELAAAIIALCPDQFRAVLGGGHIDGYCSKLGYARPLGWGSVRIEAKSLLFLTSSTGVPAMDAVLDIPEWMKHHFLAPPSLKSWLAVHRRNHPDAGDYPVGADGQVYTYHTKLRADHTRARRYDREPSR
jgi:hypothetical protein